MANPFDSDFLRDGGKRPALALAVFGKHPAWSDHMSDLGVTTRSLALLKQRLYVEGIGGNIASGQWEKLARQGQVVPFGHEFLWARGEEVIIGRLETSSDRSGRDQYPLVVAAWVRAQLLAKSMNVLSEQTRHLARQCLASSEPGELQKHHASSMQALETALDSASPVTLSKASFVESEAFAPNHQGLLRVLHSLKTQWPSRGNRATHLRVPGQSLFAWLSFLRASLPSDSLIFLAAQDNGPIDVLIGPAERGEFLCLRAGLAAMALTTSVPFSLNGEFQREAEDFLGRFVNQASPTPFLQPPKRGLLDPRRWFGE